MSEHRASPPPGDTDTADAAAVRKAARKKAMDFLARREYGAAELAGRLKGAGFDSGLAEDVIAELQEDGLQDDRRFVAGFLNAKAGRGTGPLRIRQALREKGIADAVIDAALAADETDWYEQARRVRTKKFGTSPPEDYRERARQMRFLQYRGFDYDHIDAAVGADDEA